jgi:AcrR family transcriptional regulator
MDRRITKSKDAIKGAFIELMSQTDFEDITVQDISDKANVGRRTFYHHYLDKYDLLSKLIEEHINEIRKICKSAVSGAPDAPGFTWFEYFESNYDFFSLMLNGQGVFVFRPIFLEFVIEELKTFGDVSGGKNAGLNEDIYYRFFGSAIVGTIEYYFTNGTRNAYKDMADQVMILLNRNLQVDK